MRARQAERRREMATLLGRLHGRADETSNDAIAGIDLMTPEEAYALFDRRARHLLHISGEEFLKRWDAGEYHPVPDTVEGRRVGELVMMMPFARRTKS
jgi:hypothetical protein